MIRTRSRKRVARAARRSFAILVVAAAAQLLWSAPAMGHHIAGATYTGTVASGGTIEFDVSPDGFAITRIRVTNVPGSACNVVEVEQGGSTAIGNHDFSRAAGSLSVYGSFSGVQTAQGTLSHSTCQTGEVAWTASTTASPAGSFECQDAIAAVDTAKRKVRKARNRLAQTETANAEQRARRNLRRAKRRLRNARQDRDAACG